MKVVWILFCSCLFVLQSCAGCSPQQKDTRRDMRQDRDYDEDDDYSDDDNLPRCSQNSNKSDSSLPRVRDRRQASAEKVNESKLTVKKN